MRVYYFFHKNENETISFKVFVMRADSVERRKISVTFGDPISVYITASFKVYLALVSCMTANTKIPDISANQATELLS